MVSVKKSISIKDLNTFGIDVMANSLSIVSTAEEVENIFSVNNADYLILGGGSNMLFTKNVDKVLQNNLKGIKVINEDENDIWIECFGGEVWHEFVLFCVANDYAGIENLSLIPGTVGAAPIQNIGAYGVEVKDVIERVTFWHITEQRFVTLSNRECCFGYRDSIFKNRLKRKTFIISVVFRLKKTPRFNTSYGTIQEELDKMNVSKLSIKAISDAVIRIRSLKLPDPNIIGNAGSFFKNPEVAYDIYNALKQTYQSLPGYKVDENTIKIPAGWLIEQCGWKGYRKENYGVHPKQALVLVNYGGATGTDIYQLSSEIIQSVKSRFGIMLEREVQII